MLAINVARTRLWMILDIMLELVVKKIAVVPGICFYELSISIDIDKRGSSKTITGMIQVIGDSAPEKGTMELSASFHLGLKVCAPPRLGHDPK